MQHHQLLLNKMGQIVNKVAEPLFNCGDSMANLLQRGRKRKHESHDSSVSSEDADSSCECESPKKKRLLTTTKYIYQALFKEQNNADIAVMALNRVWRLHKVYLCQSPYFHSMFNGSWRESGQECVHIKILDEQITADSLDAVFGSMYSDEIEIEPCGVISVLATATLFHLDSVIDKCAEVMNENINEQTVVKYYDAACRYGCMSVRKATFRWLEINLLCIHSRCSQLVRSISIDLMTALVNSRNLYVMQTEFSLYTLLRTWMYLRLFPDYDPDNPEHQKQQVKQIREDNGEEKEEEDTPKTSAIQAFFRARNEKHSFLATRLGQQFLKAFQGLRTQYLTNHFMDLKFLIKDNIIPREWINNHIFSHWNYILRVDHMSEEGPKTIDENEFYKNCMRCGRILLQPGYQKWRWTGFNFGLDLIVVADSRVLCVRRHHRHEHERLLSLQPNRNFIIRASVTSINAQRQPVFTQTTEIKVMSLDKNEELSLMMLDAKLVHPLLISVSLLTMQPVDQHFKEAALLSSGAELAVPISEISGNSERSRTPSNYDSATTNDSAVILLSSSSSQRDSPASSSAFSTSSTLSSSDMST